MIIVPSSIGRTSFVLIAALLTLGCASKQDLVEVQFENALECGMSRDQIYHLAVQTSVEHFFCKPIPQDPPKTFTAYLCTAQQQNTVFELQFDRAGALQSYKRGELSFPTNVRYVEDKELCS